MEDILYGFQSNDGNWVYYSLLLTIAVYFKFNRFWSLRNLDLLLLLSLSPALLLIHQGESENYHPPDGGLHSADIGYGWLFVVSLLVLTRLISDGYFKRRPRLEQNLNVSGMLFLSVSAIIFLMAKAATEPPPKVTVDTIERGQELLERVDKSVIQDSDPERHLPGPTNTAVASVSSVLSDAVLAGDDKLHLQTIAVRVMSVLAHLAVISGLLFVGYQQFGDFQLGSAMALLYLILPCTAFDFHHSHLVIPAALIVWAVAAYRKPTAAGILLGLACGSVFFPVFLLPIWLMFYWKRGAIRFTGALVITGMILISTLFFTSSDVVSFHSQLIGTINLDLMQFFGPESVTQHGFWGGESYAFRIPVFVVFLIMIFMMCLRSHQNLETLVADSAAIVVGTQFWYTSRGGVFVLWYLPLLLLVVFRPRLTHLVPPEPTTTHEAGNGVQLSTNRSRIVRVSQTGAQVLR